MRQCDIEYEKEGIVYPTAHLYKDVQPSGNTQWSLDSDENPADGAVAVQLPFLEFQLKSFKTRDVLLDAFDRALQLFDWATNATTLCLSNKYNLQAHIASLSLRLNQDGGCYNFLKWYMTVPPSTVFHDMKDQNVLELIKADPLEDPQNLPQTNDLHLLVALVLLKLRMLLDKQDMEADWQRQMEAKEGNTPATPPNITYRSSILAFKPFPWLDVAAVPLDHHITTLFDRVNRTNKHFWKILISPGGHLDATVPLQPEEGGLMEAQAMLQKCFDAWVETCGAVEWVRKKVGGTG
ncbi:hypothetical protein HDV00_002358 [Rhizophlyctis rosea]|nr:hypothetical protein HDV00_002358 [Rhizophlyctis rosea]